MGAKKRHRKNDSVKEIIANNQVSEMLEFLSAKEKEAFLLDLLSAILTYKATGDFSVVDECIEDWEDVAELNSIPGLKDKVWESFNELKDSGLIH